MEKPTAFAAYTALTASALVWGGSIVGQKMALAASAVETSVLRAVGALAILIPLWWWTEGGRATFHGSRSQVPCACWVWGCWVIIF